MAALPRSHGAGFLFAIFLLLSIAIQFKYSNAEEFVAILEVGEEQPQAAIDDSTDDSSEDSPFNLYQTGQYPTDPKPICSSEHCQRSHYISPMQFRCQATISFSSEAREVTLIGCRCCPLPMDVYCENGDCRAPVGTRQCVSEQLEGCICETWDDRREIWLRDYPNSEMPVLPEGHIQEDFIEVDDDDYPPYPPIQSMRTIQTLLTTAGPRASPSLMHNRHELESNATGWMAWPTVAASEPFATTTRAAQLYFVRSGY